jgi:hypothetical protein
MVGDYTLWMGRRLDVLGERLDECGDARVIADGTWAI